MIGRLLSRKLAVPCVAPARNFGTLSILHNKTSSSSPNEKFQSPNEKFQSPKEYVAKKQLEQIEEQAYQSSLLNEEFEYAPKYLSKNEVNPITKRPMPINVELLKYEPLRLPKTHGHEVAQIKFKSYNEESLIRASEFVARAAFYLGIPCDAIQPLKTEKRLYTVIRSPFAQAKSKENFHRVTYQRKLTAFDANPEVVDLWLSFVNKHALEDVKLQASIHTREGLDFTEKLDNITSDDLKLPEAFGDIDDPITAKVEEILKSDNFKKFFDNDAKK